MDLLPFSTEQRGDVKIACAHISAKRSTSKLFISRKGHSNE